MKFNTIIGHVKLTSERKLHIIETHPIMEGYLKYFKKVLENPKEVRFSSYDDNVLLFYQYFDIIENGKYIVVVINQKTKSVVTAYLSHRIKTGRKYEKG